MQLLSVSIVSCPCRKDTSRIVTALNYSVIDDDVDDDDDDDDDDDGYMVMIIQCLCCYSCCVASHTCTHYCNSDRYEYYYFHCLCGIHTCVGVMLSPCGSDNTAEVVQGKTGNTFTCSGLGSRQKVCWTLLYQTVVYIAGNCPAVSSGGSCSRGDLRAAFTPSRTSNTKSTLTVDATRLNNVVVILLGTLKCADTSNEDSCQTDYVGEYFPAVFI